MPEPVRILSIDGGGIRGIIPAMILAELERRAGRPACRLFDFIAGTSTGGIIALAVTKPDAAGRDPAFSAAELIALYEREGPAIFAPAWHRWPVIGFLYDRFFVRYSGRTLERVTRRYFGDTRLSQAIVPLLVTSYELHTRTPWFFKSENAKQSAADDYPMHVAAYATSAAPTYFPPIRVPAPPPTSWYAFLDGGVYAQNPAMCAYVEAHMTYPEARDFLIVSLGTGKTETPIPYQQSKRWGVVGWARPILDVVFDGVSDTVDYELDQLLPPGGGSKRHYRFQPELAAGEDSLDDASQANLQRLKGRGQQLIADNDAVLTGLSEELKRS